ncbi:transcription factor-like protein DPB isoform X1 [Physcomitrium patens]|uniref:Transcription factor-like protein DPB n=2 Tax=Physcomitrium patens TaxID=3218 RepID=A0A7I4AIZ2_PHYPA|nr:transcription factor-like protein DPB [Physcomitrium patens]|eukprot:XP_024391963.1 transcription factor-like protein DPB [Physcomitrella patens]
MVSNGIDARLSHLDDPDSPDAEVIGGKKKRGGRAGGGEKGGKGLRHFSMKVCEKVESKGRTTYNEVADELVAEFTNPDSPHVSPDQQQYDEKNIRRRVYDALNVLMAVGIILKDKKDIQWKGFPSASLDDVADLKAESMRIRGRIERKSAYLHELQSQMTGLRNLVSRNERLSQGNNSVPHVALPFILVQTRPQATVEVEISEDMQVVHFDFNSTPFELHDDAYVLKAMNLQEQPDSNCPDGLDHADFDDGLGNFGEDSPPLSGVFQRSMYPAHPSSPYYASMSSAGKNSSWPPVPGILKSKVKHENAS